MILENDFQVCYIIYRLEEDISFRAYSPKYNTHYTKKALTSGGLF